MFIKWLKYKYILYFKIYLTYVIEILCRIIWRYYAENILELCCYFKTKQVFYFI